jgi:two-component system, NarL family, sensor kinase
MSNHQTRKRQQADQENFLANELHDGACQYVIAARMAFDTFRHEHAGVASGGNWGGFDGGLTFLDHAIEELRRLVRGLQPLKRAAGGLAVAVSHLIKELRVVGGPDIEYCHDLRANQIHPQLELAAFRIVQESLANAYRHSKSKRILVDIRHNDGCVHIQVQDWGVGFDPDNVPIEHFGLEGIRRRVNVLGGAVAIHSQPGCGTCVTVELPLLE